MRIIAAVIASLATSAACAQSIDTFNPLPQGQPTSITRQADGKLILVGNFLNIAGTPRTRVARLNVDGSLDTTFADPDVDSEVKTAAVQADGKILLGGGFTSVGGAPRHYLARLNGDGTLDTSFVDPNLDSTVWSIAIQPDDKILVVGDFAHAGATARAYVARFDASGNLDAGYADPQICCLPARAVALENDGRVLVGGFFSHVGAAEHFYFARFSSSGAFDPAFPALDRDVQAGSIVVAPDGSIYVGDLGTGTVLKLSAAGAAASGFDSAMTDSTIDSVTLQPNGKLVIGGIFQSVGGQPRHALARLNADGSLDTSFADLHFSFDAGNENGFIDGTLAQADGKIVAFGNFTLASGQPRQFMARVATGDYATSALVVQPDAGSLSATWYRAGDGPELAQAPILEHSTDGVTFTAVGTMTHVANGWRASANYDVHGARFYLRAVGTTSDGARNTSPGLIASEVYSSDTIFHGDFE